MKGRGLAGTIELLFCQPRGIPSNRKFRKPPTNGMFLTLHTIASVCEVGSLSVSIISNECKNSRLGKSDMSGSVSEVPAIRFVALVSYVLPDWFGLACVFMFQVLSSIIFFTPFAWVSFVPNTNALVVLILPS